MRALCAAGLSELRMGRCGLAAAALSLTLTLALTLTLTLALTLTLPLTLTLTLPLTLALTRNLALTLTLYLTLTRTLALTLTLNLTLTLTLARCGVGDAAASALCDANPSLTALDLHSNQLGQRAAVALGTLPTLTPTLTIALTVTTSTLRILTTPASEPQP